MGASHVSAVFAPKAHGASRLQRVWARSPLQSFLLFSSATSTFGNAGQGNYGAANAYLDSLARARRVGGLRSCSMQLPMVTGAGMGQATVETLSAALAEQQKLWSLGLEQYASALSGLLARSAGSALAVQAPPTSGVLCPARALSMAVATVCSPTTPAAATRAAVM